LTWKLDAVTAVRDFGQELFDRLFATDIRSLFFESKRIATSQGKFLRVRLALLNACEGAYASQTDIFASTAATLVQQGIPAVIAMQYEITDDAAIEFSEQFYDALTAGLPVDSAVTDARRAVAVAINNTLEWGIPVLFMRAPDGEIFTFAEGEGSASTNAERFREGATRTQDDQPILAPSRKP